MRWSLLQHSDGHDGHDPPCLLSTVQAGGVTKLGYCLIGPFIIAVDHVHPCPPRGKTDPQQLSDAETSPNLCAPSCMQLNLCPEGKVMSILKANRSSLVAARCPSL